MSTLLRIEHAAVVAAMLIAYHLVGGNWWIFALLILVPDVFMLGYLAGPKVGAWSYNSVHCWPAPVALWLVGLAGGWLLSTELALILAAHIGIDRMLGYGLKRESGFRDTHLGRIGTGSKA